MAREEIDPQLPYFTVHRSVGPKAAQLFPALGVTYQHVRGALDIFWEQLADRRLLAKYRRDIDGRPKLVLPAADLAKRLQLAFGCPVDLSTFETAGFAELLDDGCYRVRGGSRLLAPEIARLGKKTTPGNDRGTTPTPPGSDPGATPVPPRVTPPPHPGATPVPPRIGEREEVRGESEKTRGGGGEAKKRPPSPPNFDDVWPKRFDSAQDWWTWFQAQRVSDGCVEENPPEPDVLERWWDDVGLHLGTAGLWRLDDAHVAWRKDRHWRERSWPFAGFVAQWRDNVPPLRGAA